MTSYRQSVVRDGIVENVVERSGAPWSAPEGAQAVTIDQDAGVSIGWGYDGAGFKAPAVAPPEPAPDYDAELIEAIKAATTLAGLKAALIGSLEGAKARVGARPK